MARTTPERESLVAVALKHDGKGTLLTLKHDQFFDEAVRDRHGRGWKETLDKLEAERRTPDERTARRRRPCAAQSAFSMVKPTLSVT